MPLQKREPVEIEAVVGPQSEKQVKVEEAAIAAEVSAEHAVRAAEQAEKDEIAARRVAANELLCPHCHTETIPHGDANPHKLGARHCNRCGSCWAPGMRHQRAGHFVSMADA